MSEAELKLVTDAKNCTMYTIQFLSDDDSEFEKFYAKFRNELEYNEDFERLLKIPSKDMSSHSTYNQLT